MEGINILGLLLGFLGVVVLGLFALVALGLLVAGWARGARLTFASGWLLASLIEVLAALSFLSKEVNNDLGMALTLFIALILLLAGAGQFIAGLRDGRTFAASLACSIGSIVSLMLAESPEVISAWRLPMVFALGISLLLAVASMAIGVRAMLAPPLLELPARDREQPLDPDDWKEHIQ